MADGWRDRSSSTLTEHGLEHVPEEPFPNDGWSGATLTGLVDRGGRAVRPQADVARRRTGSSARRATSPCAKAGSSPDRRGDWPGSRGRRRLPRRRGRRRRRRDPHARPVDRAHRLGATGARPGRSTTRRSTASSMRSRGSTRCPGPSPRRDRRADWELAVVPAARSGSRC